MLGQLHPDVCPPGDRPRGGRGPAGPHLAPLDLQRQRGQAGDAEPRQRPFTNFIKKQEKWSGLGSLSYKFNHQMGQFALVTKLSTRWRHLH